MPDLRKITLTQDQLKDYGTTILFYLIPLLIANQVAIMAQIPQQYSWIAGIFFGIISQYYSNNRNA